MPEAFAFSAEGGANLLAMALAFAFCAANCGRLVGWNRKEAVQEISNLHVSNPYLDEPGAYTNHVPASDCCCFFAASSCSGEPSAGLV